MRLICPNCDAQYEVDDAAISDEGRDVQCSNCGHAWFQLPLDAVTETVVEKPQPPKATGLRAAPEAPPAAQPDAVQPSLPDDAEHEREPSATPPSEEPANAPSADTAEAEIEAPVAPAVPRRTMDESLLAVLREEAERETAVRRSETPRPLESQPDLGLEETTGAASAAKAVRDRLARLRGPEPEPETAEKPTARRDLLPDIEEINSTLRASSENRSNETFSTAQGDSAETTSNSGFRLGFSTMLLIAVLLVAVYLFAPKIAAQFPAAEAGLDRYVVSVNATRVWLDGAMRDAIAALQNLTSGSAG